MTSKAIGPGTRICAVIGSPIAHSLSPTVHNAAFRELGLDYIYVAHHVVDVKGALDGMRALEGFRGMSVTIPHKIRALSLVDQTCTLAREIGAINTITREDDGRLTGTNTDGWGALRALQSGGTQPEGLNVTLIGTGGSARAIAVTLAREAKPASIVLVGRTQSKAQSLETLVRSYTQVRVSPWADRDDAAARADIVINTTPLGMHPHSKESPLTRALSESQLAMDIVYNPLETRLLRTSRTAGATTINGLEMFIEQAAMQFEIWTGQKAPIKTMREAALAAL